MKNISHIQPQTKTCQLWLSCAIRDGSEEGECQVLAFTQDLKVMSQTTDHHTLRFICAKVKQFSWLCFIFCLSLLRQNRLSSSVTGSESWWYIFKLHSSGCTHILVFHVWSLKAAVEIIY